MYFDVNFNVFFKLIKVHLLVNEIYIYQNARCNDKNCTNVHFSPVSLLHFNGLYPHISSSAKYSNIQFHKNQSKGSRNFQCGRTDRQADRHDEANSRFRNFANAPKNQRNLFTFQQYTVVVTIHIINWLVFLIEAHRVSCEVRIESLYTMQIDFRLYRVNVHIKTLTFRRLTSTIVDVPHR